MDQEILDKFSQEDQKLEAIRVSVDKIRKYLLWTFIITAATIVLPLIALAIAIPWFLSVLSSAYGSLGL
jgi:hypothetical protein